MQAYEKEMGSLRRAMRQLREWIRGPRGRQAVVSARLAADLGLPNDEVSRILDRTAADLRKLSDDEADDVDARPIIDRAVSELSQLGIRSRPFEDAALERFLQELPDRDYQILRHFKLGKKHREIAELLNTDVEDIRSSLVKTYSGLRMSMVHSTDDGGGGEPCDMPPSKTCTKPLKQSVTQ